MIIRLYALRPMLTRCFSAAGSAAANSGRTLRWPELGDNRQGHHSIHNFYPTVLKAFRIVRLTWK